MPYERTRLWTDQQRSIPSTVETIKEQFQISFTASIGRRPGQLC
jgi:hypothetical protein